MSTAQARCQRLKQLICVFKSSSVGLFQFSLYFPLWNLYSCTKLLEVWLSYRWCFKRGGEWWSLQVALLRQQLQVDAHFFSLREWELQVWRSLCGDVRAEAWLTQPAAPVKTQSSVSFHLCLLCVWVRLFVVPFYLFVFHSLVSVFKSISKLQSDVCSLPVCAFLPSRLRLSCTQFVF